MADPIARSGANFFGFEYIEGGKRRRNQRVIRGNGTLELYEDRLVFSRLAPRASYTVPIDTVTGVEIGRGHNGKIVWPATFSRWPIETAGARRIGLHLRKREAAEKWADAVCRLAGLTR